tara:strand:- start:611 stop:844 length:234 start_codon:yes stop_codon:yes gene_type:complete
MFIGAYKFCKEIVVETVQNLPAATILVAAASGICAWLKTTKLSLLVSSQYVNPVMVPVMSAIMITYILAFTSQYWCA